MFYTFAHPQRAALLVTATCVTTYALPFSSNPSTANVDLRRELEESSFRKLPMQVPRGDLAAELIDAELSLLIPSTTADHEETFATRAELLDATITTKTVETSQTGGSCPGAIAVFTDTWQLDVFPIATLTLLSCILVLLTALIISHITRIRRFARTSPVLVSPPSPSVRNLSIGIPSKAPSIKDDGGRSLHPIPERSLPATPTEQSFWCFGRSQSPSPSYSSSRLPDSPARSTFRSTLHPNGVEKKPSYQSLKN